MDHIIKNGTVYIAPSAVITGDVTLEQDVSVWHGTVIRGDCGKIHIGERTNIQDRCILHSETTIGKGCTIGHGAIVHGCTVGDHSMIGMGAIVLSDAVIGNHCVVGAGAVVKEKMVVPDGHVVLGIPARIVGPIKQSLLDDIAENEVDYIRLAKEAFAE